MDFNIVTEQLPSDVLQWINTLQSSDVVSILSNAYIIHTAKILHNIGDHGVSVENNNLNSPESKKTTASATIGISGERLVYTILSKKYIVTCTSKSRYTGDFILTIDGMRFIIEVKKYNKSVPSAEIDKLYRDMECSSSVQGGILISLTSRITGISKIMDYNHQLINGHMSPIIFLTTYSINDEKTIEACIYAAVDILVTECKSKQRCINIEGDISDTIYDIGQHVDDLSRSRNIISETQSIINKQFMKLALCITTAEVNIKNSISILQSKISDTSVVPVDNKTVINDLKLKDIKQITLLRRVVDGINILSDSKNTLQSDNKKLIIKIKTSNITVNILIPNLDISNVPVLNGQWTYNGKILSVVLNENNIEALVNLITLYVLQ